MLKRSIFSSMLSADELYKIARSRFNEARVLASNDHPDGAVYLCGYALELILKRKIVLLLNWEGYPENNAEFKEYGLWSFKTHALGDLLHLCGLERDLLEDTEVEASWRKAKNWDSQNRYRRIDDIDVDEATSTIEATRRVVNWILKS